MKWFSIIYQHLTSWRFEMVLPKGVHKGVLIGAPHTSNVDFFVTMAFLSAFPFRFNYIIKKSWIDSPFGFIFKYTGGIGVDRKSDNKQFVADLEAELIKRKQLLLVMSPEGTRSYVQRWKTGFYRIARGAKLPIFLGKADFKKKELTVNRTFWPTGNMDIDFELLEFEYANVEAKNSSKFNRSFRDY